MRATDWGKKDIRLGRNKKLRRKQIGYGAGLNVKDATTAAM